MPSPYEVFRSRIPPALGIYMDELEAFAGRRLRVAVRSDGSAFMGTFMQLNDGGARIEVPPEQLVDAEKFRADSACHELAHIDRYWRQNTPKLEPFFALGDYTKELRALNNMMEHVFLAPVESRFGFDPVTFTTGQLCEMHEMLKGLTAAQAPHVAFSALRWLLSKEILKPEAYRDFINLAKKRKLGKLVDLADELRPRMKDDKRGVVRRIYSAFKLPRPGSSFVIFDPRQSRSHSEHL